MMSAREYLVTFDDDDDSDLSQAIHVLVTYGLEPNMMEAPVALTRLLTHPTAWTQIWQDHGTLSHAAISRTVRKLKTLLRQTGLRPWSENYPPIVPSDQSLRSILPIMNHEMLDEAAVADLGAIGIETFLELATASTDTLRKRFSPLRSDLLRVSETLYAFGYSLSSDKHDQANLQP